MRRILLLAVNDLRRTFRDRSSIAWLFLMPVALMWFFGQMSSGPGETPRISLAVEDRDGGWLARALVRELADEAVVLSEVESRATGVDRAGDGAAGKDEPPIRALIIPEGFTRGALAGDQQTLRLEARSDSNQDYGLAAQVHILRAAVRVTGRLVELQVDGDDLAGPAAADRFLMLAGEHQLEPPAVGLVVRTAGGGVQTPSGIAQSVPGMLTMTVLMMTLIIGASILAAERRDGTLRRLSGLPISSRRLFFGKLTGRLLLAALQIVVLLAAGRFVFGLSFGSSPLALLLLLAAYAFAVASLALWLGAMVKSPEQAEPIAWLSSMVMAALGGCWWPSELMPEWLRNAAHVFPTAWAMDGLHSLISFGHGLAGVMLPAAVLALFGLGFAWLGSRALDL